MMCKPHWTCHVCGLLRADDVISVLSLDVSEDFDLPPNAVIQNIRHCNDRQSCIDGAQSKRIVRSKETSDDRAE